MTNDWRLVADVIRDVGWTQKEFWNEDTGNVCLLGACGLAWHDDPEYFGGVFSVFRSRLPVDDTDRIRELSVAIGDWQQTHHEVYRWLGDSSRVSLDTAAKNISDFNDYYATSVQDVLDVLDRLEQGS